MTEKRPAWAKDGEMQEYYDHYWGIPVHNEHDLFRMLVLESFQAGLSWSTVWKKRHAFDQAFDDFDVEKMAALTAVDVDKLMGNPDIIRNRRKIEAAIHNPKCYSLIIRREKPWSTLFGPLWMGHLFKCTPKRILSCQAQLH